MARGTAIRTMAPSPHMSSHGTYAQPWSLMEIDISQHDGKWRDSSLAICRRAVGMVQTEASAWK